MQVVSERPCPALVRDVVREREGNKYLSISKNGSDSNIYGLRNTIQADSTELLTEDERRENY